MIQFERETISRWVHVIHEVQDFIDSESGKIDCIPEFNHNDAVERLESIVREIKDVVNDHH